VNKILRMTIVALLSTALAGCWLYSRDTVAGCQKTTYGILVASTTTVDCTPAPDAGTPPTPSSGPKVLPPSTQ